MGLSSLDLGLVLQVLSSICRGELRQKGCVGMSMRHSTSFNVRERYRVLVNVQGAKEIRDMMCMANESTVCSTERVGMADRKEGAWSVNEGPIVGLTR